MAYFTPVAWEKGWSKSIEKFKILKQNRAISRRSYFQRDNCLMIEFSFDNDEFLVIPADIFENALAESDG